MDKSTITAKSAIWKWHHGGGGREGAVRVGSGLPLSLPPSFPPALLPPSVGSVLALSAAQRTKTQSRCIRKIATAAVVGCRVGWEAGGQKGEREGEPIEKSTRPVALPPWLAQRCMTEVSRHTLITKMSSLDLRIHRSYSKIWKI